VAIQASSTACSPLVARGGHSPGLLVRVPNKLIVTRFCNIASPAYGYGWLIGKVKALLEDLLATSKPHKRSEASDDNGVQRFRAERKLQHERGIHGYRAVKQATTNHRHLECDHRVDRANTSVGVPLKHSYTTTTERWHIIRNGAQGSVKATEESTR
jgi:hypothetical protein